MNEGEKASSSVIAIRSVNRNYVRDLRNKHKEFLLNNKRLRLHDVSEYLHEVTISEFSELLSKLGQKSASLAVLRKIKNSCVGQEYIEAVFKENGVFNKLIALFIGQDAQKQLEAAACLTNIACGSHRCCSQVAKKSGAYLVSFIDGSSPFVQEQCSWALANIASDCLTCFNIIKAQGVLPALIKALQSPVSSVIQNVVFALNACTQYEDPQVISNIQPSLLKHLLSILEQNNLNEPVFLDAAFTLSNCCFLSAKYSLNHLDIRDVEKILTLLLSIIKNTEIDILIATPLVRCIGFLSYDDRICDFLALHHGFFRSIEILTTEKKYTHLSKEAFWVLSNVIAGSRNLNMLHFMPILDNLKCNLKVDSSTTLQVLYFLLILVSKNDHVRDHEIFSQIESLLQSKNKDEEAVTSFLEIVQNLYKIVPM